MGTYVLSYLVVLKLIYLVIAFFWSLGSLGFRNATLAQTTLNCQSWLGAENQTSLKIYIHLEAPHSLKIYVQVLISVNKLDEKKNTCQTWGLFKQRRSPSPLGDLEAVLLHLLHAFHWPLIPLLRQRLRHFVTGGVRRHMTWCLAERAKGVVLRKHTCVSIDVSALTITFSWPITEK